MEEKRINEEVIEIKREKRWKKRMNIKGERKDIKDRIEEIKTGIRKWNKKNKRKKIDRERKT